MAKMSGVLSKAVIGVIVAAIVLGGGYYLFFTGSSTKTVKAQFAEAVGIYVGTPVRILGVNVGEVSAVKPQAQYVDVTMTYDSKYRIRASDASAVEVANSLVSDRYINLGTLISSSNPAPALASGATIPLGRTDGPAELDDIYAQLDRLAVALGPTGANAGGKDNGALSLLLKVSAANLKGNGLALGQSITQLSKAARTLANYRGDLFGTVKNLQKFTGALKQSDAQVRRFNTQLAQVAGDLAGERSDLGAALNQLGLALNDVQAFVKGNQAKFHTDIKGLENITNILVSQKASLKETLAIAPIALANIVHAYEPDLGALATRSNLVSLTNGLSATQLTSLVCGLVKKVAGGTLASLPINLGSVLDPVCTPATKTTAPTTAKTNSAGATNTASTSTASTGTTGTRAGSTSPGELNAGLPAGLLVGSGS